MNKGYRADLSQAEREQLIALLSGGQNPARAAAKLSSKAILVAIACTKPPAGRRNCWHARWRRSPSTTTCRETVRRRLAENKLKPGRREM